MHKHIGYKIQHAFKSNVLLQIMYFFEKKPHPHPTQMKMTWNSLELLAVYPKEFAMALEKPLENDSDEKYKIFYYFCYIIPFFFCLAF